MSSKFNIDQSIMGTSLEMINTQVLHPISINQNEATIIIPNRGGSLDKNSAIVLPCTTDPANNFLPINTGIASLLSSVSLVCNGQVIAQNTEPGQYITMANCFKPQQHRDKVLMPKMGVRETYDIAKTGQLDPANTAGNILARPGKITLKDLEYQKDAANTGGYNNAVDSFTGGFQPGVGNANYRLNTASATTANYYLYLEDIFPKLYGSLELPLYLIEGEVSLVIRFSSNTGNTNLNERVCSTSANAVHHSNCEILTDEVVLLTDYLVPTIETKNALVQQVMSNEGLVINYADLIYNNYLIQGLANVNDVRNYKRDVFQLALSNKVVRQLYLMFTPTQNADLDPGATPYGTAGANQINDFTSYNAVNGLKNKYCSKALSYLPDGEKIQISFNSKNVFNTPLQGSGQKLNELQIAYGASFCMPSSTYDFSDIVVDSIDKQMNGYEDKEGRLFYQKSLLSYTEGAMGLNLQNLVGQNHYIGVNLQKPTLTADNRLLRVNVSGSGTRCGSVPIEIQIDRLCNRGEPNDNRNMIVCACVEKTLQLRNGQIFVEYS